MPELPEVEFLRRALVPLQGNRIARASARDERIFEAPLAPDSLSDRLRSRTLRSLQRLGKYLLMRFEEGSLLFSLRMTGQFYWVEDFPGEPQYVKLVLEWEQDVPDLVFCSVRRLSRVHWVPGNDPRECEKLSRLGPDPLGEDYTPESFREAFEGRRGPLKSLLMDQSFLAGIGNIYASEICFVAGIHPGRRAPDLLTSDRRQLYGVVPRILRKAVARGGSSFQNFRGVDGQIGGYQRFFEVYGREDEPCVHCGSPIQQIEMAGRSTFFCEVCQE